MAPANDDTQQFTIQLPAGIKCTGGTNQNLCLASITTTSGLGNCVVVSQAADAIDTARSPSNTSQATDVRSVVGKRMRVIRSATADDSEEGSEPAPAKGDQTSPRKGDKLKKANRKEKKNKKMTRHNQRITGKRICKLFCLWRRCTRAVPNLRTRVLSFVPINQAYMTSDGLCVCIIDGMDSRLFYKA
jgi:hypothetical protein